MTESNQNPSGTGFAGTYFDRDSVLRLSRIADVFAWVALAYHGGQVLLSVTILVLQLIRGLIRLPGLTDFAQQLVWMFQPLVPGMLYFLAFQAVGKILLIFMDMEDNTRRAARNKD